ncbi:hypothetical protein ILYODFUR_003251 [Ilyodon furcidens]|uniref:Uncharacterized protein n=1 Tax=Ilyodon furcidens TaxID=33524 RepID=A0ABV0UZV9_9TELE
MSRRINWVSNHDCVVKHIATGRKVWTALVTGTEIDRKTEKRREMPTVEIKTRITSKCIFSCSDCSSVSPVSPESDNKTDPDSIIAKNVPAGGMPPVSLLKEQYT